MTGPQLKNGYTRIANEILEQVPRHRFNGTQLRILLVIWRFTYGFKRKEHEFSLSFLAEAIRASRSQVDREVTALIDRHVLEVVSGGNGKPRVLRFNKNHDEWAGEKCTRNRGQFGEQTVLGIEDTLSSTLGTEVSSTWGTKKEKKKNIKKNTRQRKTYAEDSTYFKMAVYFYDKVSSVAKTEGLEHLTIKADMQKWADEFRKLVEIDKVEDKRLIRDVMDWVTADTFWKTNVLSAKKLREKFGELALKMRTERKSGKKNTQTSSIDRLMAAQDWIDNGGDPYDFDPGQ